MGLKKEYKELLSKNIKLEKMTIEDIPQIAKIFISYWGSMCLYSDKQFEMIINQNISFVYKNQNEVIAFCLMKYNFMNNIISVDILCVKEEYKGFHLGQNILTFCLNNCMELGFRNFSLHVSTTNIPAFNLYKKIGFVIKDMVKNYYIDVKPEDSNAYYMELNI